MKRLQRPPHEFLDIRLASRNADHNCGAVQRCQSVLPAGKPGSQSRIDRVEFGGISQKLIQVHGERVRRQSGAPSETFMLASPVRPAGHTLRLPARSALAKPIRSGGAVRK
jgi:hypothetical protein